MASKAIKAKMEREALKQDYITFGHAGMRVLGTKATQPRPPSGVYGFSPPTKSGGGRGAQRASRPVSVYGFDTEPGHRASGFYGFDGTQRESVLAQVGEEAEDAEGAADEEEFEEMIAENQVLSERAKRVTDLLSQGGNSNCDKGTLDEVAEWLLFNPEFRERTEMICGFDDDESSVMADGKGSAIERSFFKNFKLDTHQLLDLYAAMRILGLNPDNLTHLRNTSLDLAKDGSVQKFEYILGLGKRLKEWIPGLSEQERAGIDQVVDDLIKVILSKDLVAYYLKRIHDGDISAANRVSQTPLFTHLLSDARFRDDLEGVRLFELTMIELQTMRAENDAKVAVARKELEEEPAIKAQVAKDAHQQAQELGLSDAERDSFIKTKLVQLQEDPTRTSMVIRSMENAFKRAEESLLEDFARKLSFQRSETK
eukprot:m.19135 g.19135  ORF g.19135 m.19135 type:complete len:427 (+) comp11719_c0_seq3:268-1548(+)